MGVVDVLVVDDEAGIAELLSDLLGDELGYTVQLAHNGAEALVALRCHRPALLITDLMMPYMDGQALVQAVAAEPTLQALPIITMSAAGACPRWVQEKQLPFIAKPFELGTLITLVRRVLETSPFRGIALA